MADFVYALCALTSLACFVLLLRQHRKSPGPLLFRSALAFLFFAASNIALFVDLIVVPTVDLSLLRAGLNLLGVGLLLAGLIRSHREEESG
jgi:hypothetical protein